MIRDFKIWFDSKSTARRVLGKLGSNGARWRQNPGIPALYEAVIRPSFGISVRHTDRGIVLTDTVSKQDFYKKKDFASLKEISPDDYLGGKVRHAEFESVALYRNGRVVTAVDKITKKVGIAKCSPEDEFDFSVGAAIALERLADENEEGLGINTKFVVTDNNDNLKFTIGGMYEVVDGFFIDDDGKRSPETCRLKSREDMMEYLSNGNKPAKRYNCLICPIEYVEILDRSGF